jgi:hypothetical protein
MNRIEESRRELELRLEQVREALRSEFGRVPKRRAWVLGLLAGAVGLTVALRLRSRRRPTRKRRLDA